MSPDFTRDEVEKVVAFKSPDGSLHTSHKKASEHQITRQLYAWTRKHFPNDYSDLVLDKLLDQAGSLWPILSQWDYLHSPLYRDLFPDTETTP